VHHGLKFEVKFIAASPELVHFIPILVDQHWLSMLFEEHIVVMLHYLDAHLELFDFDVAKVDLLFKRHQTSLSDQSFFKLR
jgi:hypothetical protein